MNTPTPSPSSSTGTATGTPAQLSRRRLLGALITVPASAAVLTACGSSTSTSTSGAASATATTAPTATTTAVAATATPAATEAVVAGAWASGGTDLITVDYPDLSIFDTQNACSLSLTQATTEGPCYFSSDTGEDIAEGKTGLPMQLCLLLVDDTCAPLADHVIEVWHCDTRGIYSGDTSASDDASRFAGDFCTAGDAEAESSIYFRGQLTTDTDGRFNFKTCFPGWYAGRTIHIHFAVSDPDGTTRVISQFCFTDEFCDEICTDHQLYADRGLQDTPLAGGTDTVFPADYEPFLLTTTQNSDGTLLGHGVVRIDPTAVAESASGAPGGGGAPGDRGGPPGGD